MMKQCRQCRKDEGKKYIYTKDLMKQELKSKAKFFPPCR